jgi:hypothetical protein
MIYSAPFEVKLISNAVIPNRVPNARHPCARWGGNPAASFANGGEVRFVDSGGVQGRPTTGGSARPAALQVYMWRGAQPSSALWIRVESRRLRHRTIRILPWIPYLAAVGRRVGGRVLPRRSESKLGQPIPLAAVKSQIPARSDAEVEPRRA